MIALLILLLSLLAGPALAADPEITATRIMDSGSFTLPKAETRFTWQLVDAKPAALAAPVRLLRLELWYGVDYNRAADVRMTVVRERPGVPASPGVASVPGTSRMIAMVPIDHYANPSGPEVRVVVDLTPGVVIAPGDTIAVLYSGEPVYPPPLPAGPTRAHFGVVAYWIPEL